VHTSLKRLKIISKWRIGGSTEFTHWGDIDHIFQHTNHYTKDRSGNIDWDLEVEEGWILHNIFSTHFLQENKVVIHTYDPRLEFLNNNYSLCQGHFGLQRAIILGQYCYAFQVTCIGRALFEAISVS
jgi:hypothetical protein